MTMKFQRWSPAVLILLSNAVAFDACGQSTATNAVQEITRAGTQTSTAGPSNYFTGTVHVEPVWRATEEINASGGMVTFEPGARSAWYTHPKGQRLLVISGVGLTQEWG